MSWFHFNQNNSGGEFKGPALNVVVEADDAEQATERASRLGLYFDGEGDCPCCGDRWSEAYGKGDVEPMVYDVPAHAYRDMWVPPDGACTTLVVHADGRQERIDTPVETLGEHMQRVKERMDAEMAKDGAS